jgi:tight adherence protein B
MVLIIIAALFFMAALLGLITIYLGYTAVKTSPAYELKKRMRSLAIESGDRLPDDIRIEIMVAMTPFDKFLYKFKFIRKLDYMLDRAGHKIDVKVFILAVLFLATLGFLLGALVRRGIIFSILFTIIIVVLPFIYLHLARIKRITKFTEQLASALDMISRSLKAGHSLASAIQMVGSEMSEPVAGLFKSVYEEQTYGLSFKDALSHMLQRMDTPDLRFFVTAVSIYREVGGNLSEILERLANTIRERVKIRRQVRVYTAQARFSGYVLAALPFVAALIFYLMDPSYIGELFAEKVGRYLVAAAIIFQIIGYLVIKRIINIRI